MYLLRQLEKRRGHQQVRHFQAQARPKLNYAVRQVITNLPRHTDAAITRRESRASSICFPAWPVLPYPSSGTILRAAASVAPKVLIARATPFTSARMGACNGPRPLETMEFLNVRRSAAWCGPWFRAGSRAWTSVTGTGQTQADLAVYLQQPLQPDLRHMRGECIIGCLWAFPAGGE